MIEAPRFMCERAYLVTPNIAMMLILSSQSRRTKPKRVSVCLVRSLPAQRQYKFHELEGSGDVLKVNLGEILLSDLDERPKTKICGQFEIGNDDNPDETRRKKESSEPAELRC